MTRWVIYKVCGGWLVTNDTGSILSYEIPSLRVFGTMQALTSFMLAECGESNRPRNNKGRFVQQGEQT